MRFVHPRCESQENPLGLDEPRPRLSWQLVSEERGARQSAFRVIVASSPENLAADRGDLWDSGRVESDESLHVEYRGRPLPSRTRAWWKARGWDGAKESPWCDPAWWETGLLDRADWRAQWIAGPLANGPRTPGPVPFFRHEFVLDRPVASARLYATALGIYEFRLNGKPIGEDLFRPGWTDYRKRVQYQAYDVAALLRPGANALGALLGDGWYCGSVACYGRHVYGERAQLFAQLEVTFRDGTRKAIATDGTWKVGYGPILESDFMLGEAHDARSEFPGWDEPGFDDALWQTAEVFEDTGIALVAQRGPSVRRILELHPVAPPIRREGYPWPRWIYDLGQNMVGRVRLKARGPRGTTITLRHAEMLEKDGSLHTANLRTARSTDHFTLRGEGEEVFEPRFTFHGFRYVELTGVHGEPHPGDVTGIVLHSALEPTGAFECSDPLVNRLQHNIEWGQRGNFLEVPTDCPQRDERLGWTGDAQVFVRTAAFNFDVAGFFQKWMRDFADAQRADGGIPSVVPVPPAEWHEGGPAWSDAAVICPWTMYLCYGDRHLLEEAWPMMSSFVARLDATSRDGVRCEEDCGYWRGFGDWLARDGSGERGGGTPKDLLGTAFFAHSANLLARIAGVLGKKDEAAHARALFEKARTAFQRRYVTPEGLVAAPTQTASVLALHFDLLRPEHRPGVVDALVRDIEGRGVHLSTGFIGTPYLAHVLTAAGRIDVAWALLLQKTCPSWLYPVTQGATTIWERWDGWTHDGGFFPDPMNSFNHYAYGSIGEWLYAVVAGIAPDAEHPGYRRILFAPRLGGGLTHAKASLRSPLGTAESAWRIEGDRFQIEVRVPPGATARVTLPGREATARESEALPAGPGSFEICSGHWAFASRWP